MINLPISTPPTRTLNLNLHHISAYIYINNTVKSVLEFSLQSIVMLIGTVWVVVEIVDNHFSAKSTKINS